MAKKAISSTERIWIFHGKIKEFDDCPHSGCPSRSCRCLMLDGPALIARNNGPRIPSAQNALRRSGTAGQDARFERLT
jgi:hypothetical protein